MISTKEELVLANPESVPDTGTRVVTGEGAVSVKTTTDGV
jgi:peptide deformylase